MFTSDPDKRKRPSPNLRRHVFEFYGNECVICGESDRNALDIGHLDDQSWNTVFENLILVCSNENVAFDRSQRKHMGNVSGRRDRQALLARGNDLFRAGKYAQCYGCNRITARLFETGSPILISRSVECLLYSIAALRPLGHSLLLRSTILDVERVLIAYPVDSFSRADFLGQLGLVLYDFHKPNEALECHLLARQLLRPVRGGRHPDEMELRKANIMRRIALVETTTHYRPDLSHEESLFRRLRDDHSMANLLYIKAVHEAASIGLTTKVIDYADEGIHMEQKLENKWTLAELYLIRGRALSNKVRSRKKAKDDIHRAVELFRKNSIAPMSLVHDGQLTAIDPVTELQKLGINEQPLIADRSTCPISASELTRILKRVADRRGQ